MEEGVKTGTYNGIDYRIVRTDEHQNVSDANRLTDSPTAFEYEFVLYVMGEAVTNAGTIELEGWSGPGDGGEPWAKQLEKYAHAYIDGMNAVA